VTPVASAREARVFLKKGQWYLDSAVEDLEGGRYNPAVSNAVISGINCSDVICIAAMGSYSTSSDHTAAEQLLELARQAAATLPG
jgi:hypothetical protein